MSVASGQPAAGDADAARTVRQAHWLTTELLAKIALTAVFAYVAATMSHVVKMGLNGWMSETGVPVGADFVTFWAAARMALEGAAVQAFDPQAMFAAEAMAVDGSTPRFIWNYPPTYHLAILPLGLLPYGVALGAWVALCLPAYVYALHRILPHRLTVMAALAAGGTYLTVTHAQNAFLVTALLAGGLCLLLERRQVLAGVLIGLVIIKPHFGLYVPIALAAAGQWRAFGAASATVLVVVGASTAVFGIGYWAAFFDNLGFVQQMLVEGGLRHNKLVSVSVMVFTLGGGVALATALQAATALLAGGAVWLVWRRGVSLPAIAVLLVAATLPSPYAYDYDLLLLAAAAACIAREGLKTGRWLPGEREVWLAAVLGPAMLSPLALGIGVQLAPLLVLAAFAFAVARALDLGHDRVLDVFPVARA